MTEYFSLLFSRMRYVSKFSGQGDVKMKIQNDDHNFLRDVAMPFLRARWDEIDHPESIIECRGGRISRDELTRSHEQATREGRLLDAHILNELIMRYEPTVQFEQAPI
jgi:hypothetical protein